MSVLSSFCTKRQNCKAQEKACTSPTSSMPPACKLWPESGMVEMWHPSFQHPCSLTQCDKEAAQWYSVFPKEQRHNAWRIVCNSVWEPPLGDKHQPDGRGAERGQRMCNKSWECQGVRKCTRAVPWGCHTSVCPPSGWEWLCLASILGDRAGQPCTLCRWLPARTLLFSWLRQREKAWFRLSLGHTKMPFLLLFCFSF